MGTGLRIANDMELPVADTVTSTIIVYGGKGMGKTNLGAVLVEELQRAGQRWAFLDPMGVGWGLRHGATKGTRGLECLILGGPHGDVPIDPNQGVTAADIVIEEPTNTLIDFSRKQNGEMWTTGEKIRFVTAYARRLFQRQGELRSGRRREPIMQVLDEAARYVPEAVQAGALDLAASRAVWEQIVEEGRNIGLGVCLLTQRSARMAKSVSELADIMVAFRTVGPRSLDAIMDWLGTHVEKQNVRETAARVRALDRGVALLVSPGFLRHEGVIHIRKRQTYDSSETPRPGQRARGPAGETAKPDLARIRERMAATIAETEGNDPIRLKRRIAELEKIVAKTQAATPGPNYRDSKQAKRFAELAAQFGRAVTRLEGVAIGLNATGRDILRATHALTPRAPSVAASSATQRTTTPAPSREAEHPTNPPPTRRATNEIVPADNGSAPDGGMRRLLVALTERPGLDKRALALLAEMSPKSSTYATYLGRARRSGWIQKDGERFFITPAGEAARGTTANAIRSGEALLRYWVGKLGGGRGRLLEAAAQGPAGNITLAERVKMSHTSSTFVTYLGQLRRLGLIERSGTHYTIAPELAE